VGVPVSGVRIRSKGFVFIHIKSNCFKSFEVIVNNNYYSYPPPLEVQILYYVHIIFSQIRLVPFFPEGRADKILICMV
jgi:hypothetical protein